MVEGNGLLYRGMCMCGVGGYVRVTGVYVCVYMHIHPYPNQFTPTIHPIYTQYTPTIHPTHPQYTQHIHKPNKKKTLLRPRTHNPLTYLVHTGPLGDGECLVTVHEPGDVFRPANEPGQRSVHEEEDVLNDVIGLLVVIKG